MEGIVIISLFMDLLFTFTKFQGSGALEFGTGHRAYAYDTHHLDLNQLMRPSASPSVHTYVGLGGAYISLGDDFTHDIIVYCG